MFSKKSLVVLLVFNMVKDEVLRLELAASSYSPAVWNTPNPLDLQLCRAYEKKRSSQFQRFFAVELDSVRGITFFSSHQLYGVHIHRSTAPCASLSLQRLLSRRRRSTLWCYLLITNQDRILVLGVRLSANLGFNILVRMQKAGDVIIGLGFQCDCFACIGALQFLMQAVAGSAGTGRVCLNRGEAPRREDCQSKPSALLRRQTNQSLLDYSTTLTVRTWSSTQRSTSYLLILYFLGAKDYSSKAASQLCKHAVQKLRDTSYRLARLLNQGLERLSANIGRSKQHYFLPQIGRFFRALSVSFIYVLYQSYSCYQRLIFIKRKVSRIIKQS